MHVGARIVLLVVISLVLVTGSLVAVREASFRAQRQREAGLREGIVLLKKGQFERGFDKIFPFAMAGHPQALVEIGLAYALGWGVPVDEVRAAIWLRRAQCDCPHSGELEHHAAWMLLREVEKGSEPRLTLRWLVRAAEAGYEPAQRLLGDAERLREKGFPVDKALVAYWSDFDLESPPNR